MPGLKYSDDRTSVGGLINWSMITTGSKIPEPIWDFFGDSVRIQDNNSVDIQIYYNNEPIRCRIYKSGNSRTLSWQNTPIMTALIRKFGKDRDKFEQSEVNTVKIEKASNNYKISFSFDDACETNKQCGIYIFNIENHLMFYPNNANDARKYIELAIALRKGQAAFREKLLNAYSYKCAVTGCDAVESLEAAHIIPYKGGWTDHIQNGLLLRADIHTLFDKKKITIDKDYKIKLHPELLKGHYKELYQKQITLPKDELNWPNKEALAIHRTKEEP